MKFTGTIATDLSGSIGGVTASRNSAGGYFKQKPNPVQPNTLAQANAKASFGVASSAYAALSASEKSLWRQFAQTNFSPKGGVISGIATGQQAFTALSTSFDASFRLGRTYDLTVNGSPLIGGDTRLPFVPPFGNPPALPSAPQWDTEGGVALPLVLTDAGLKADGEVFVDFTVGNGLGADMTNFQNPYGSNFGIMVMMSNGNAQQNQSYSNPENNIIAYFAPPGATVPADLDSVNDFQMTTNDTFDTSRYQRYPITGQYVLLTAYAVTQNNQLDKIGVVEVAVAPV